jgi:hypothetical protein
LQLIYPLKMMVPYSGEKNNNIFLNRPSPNPLKNHLKKLTPPEANLNMTTMNTNNHYSPLLTSINTTINTTILIPNHPRLPPVRIPQRFRPVLGRAPHRRAVVAQPPLRVLRGVPRLGARSREAHGRGVAWRRLRPGFERPKKKVKAEK